MLEEGNVLKTWALAELPQAWSGLSVSEPFPVIAASNTVEAEQLADHRPAYLDYEGPVSGERGTVRKLDAGSYVCRREPMSFSLEGQFIHGNVILQPGSDEDAKWQLVVRPADRVIDP